MNILMVTEIYLPIWGGAENQLRQLIPHLQERGCEITVVTRRWHKEWSKREVVDGVEVIRLGTPGRTIRSTIIFILSLMGYLLFHKSNYDIFHSHGAVNMGTLCTLAARLAKRKNVIKIASAGRIPDLAKKFPGRLILKVFTRADAVIAMTREIQDELNDIGLRGEKAVQITNGVNTLRFSPASQVAKKKWRAQQGLPENSRIVLFSSRLVFGKGLDVLLKAWEKIAASFPDTYVLVVGSGADQKDANESEMKLFVKKQKIPRVIFYGATAEPESLLQIADVFTFPSRREGFPNALMEAMAAELPIVASRIGGVMPLIDDQRNGILFESENEEDLSEKLNSVLMNLENCRQLGENARRDMKEKYSFHKISQEYVNLYSGLLSRKKGNYRLAIEDQE